MQETREGQSGAVNGLADTRVTLNSPGTEDRGAQKEIKGRVELGWSLSRPPEDQSLPGGNRGKGLGESFEKRLDVSNNSRTGHSNRKSGEENEGGSRKRTGEKKRESSITKTLRPTP